MNYKISENFRSNFKKALKGLAVCCALSLLLVIVFYSPKSSLATLPSCTSIASPNTPNPGVNCLPSCDSLAIGIAARPGDNCLYQNLPICTTNPYAVSTISTPNPRVNCADLIDMPLCSDISDGGGAISELKNCVKECADIAEDTTKIRGVDYAVHNRDCVRFCGTTLSTGATNNEILTDPAYLALSSDQKCIAKRCHQSVDGYTGAGSCNLLACNLLLVEELDNSHFTLPNPGADTKEFCDGSSVKCYDFPQNKLPFLVSRSKNTMCQIHECVPQPQPASPNCKDDTVAIVNKGNSFVQAYEQYIVGIDPAVEAPAALNAGDGNAAVKAQLASNCTPSTTTCLPLVERLYRCTPVTDANPTTPDARCLGSACRSDGFCRLSIDCNTSPKEPECVAPDSGEEGTSDTDNEPDESWFYNPKPMEKSVDSHGILLSHMSDNLCYSKNDLDDNNWGWDGKVKIGLVTIPLGYFHSQFSPDKTRSPGMCDVPKGGYRGTGYLYLCGNEGNINSKVDEGTAYHQENATTTFTDTDTITKLSVCVRFKNAVRPSAFEDESETCGRRECAINCSFGNCTGQLCGFDVCKSLTVKQSKATDCIMNDSMFENANDKDCSSIIDDYLRVRAVQYKNKICTFLDSKGQFAYNRNLFMHGNEKSGDTCFGDAAAGPDDSCNGKDSTTSEGLADKWRAVMHIPYILNNRGSNDDKGYIKKDGTLVKEQDCIKVPLRVRPPKLFNLATKDNSFRLFDPPLYIINSYVTKNGAVSPPVSESDSFGPTDFNYPEIEVQYGTNITQKLSLGLNKTGYEVDDEDKDPNASARITTSFNDLDYSADISIRKEFNQNTLTPTLCLYQTILDSNNIPQTLLLECVNRNLPEINNATQITPATKKAVISAPTSPANTYDSAKIILKYQGSPATDVSSEVTLGNAVQSVPECSSAVEKYQICAQREQCNLLSNECVKNEISIQNASYGSDISSFLSYRNYCNNILTPICNRKDGIIVDTSTTPSTTTTLTKAYGWYNEICISSGFDSKLKDIVAYRAMNGSNPVDSVMGKCVINSALSKGTCANGGKPPECICLDYVNSMTIDANQIVRKQTLREAGLCIDIPTPGMCPVIKYLTDSARTAGTISGNADFLTAAFGGMNNVNGQCIGNWKNNTVNGVSAPPTMNCLVGANDTASWNNSVQNACIRYSCSQVTTTPSVDPVTFNISYTNSYAAGENTDTNKGQSHGYAIWPAKTSNDLDQSVSASACITGFRANGALPTRNCSPKGVWKDLTNSCVRITCPALNFVSNSTQGSAAWLAAWATNVNNPSRYAQGSSGWTQAWTAWNNAGGAIFPSKPAARVVVSEAQPNVEPESIAYGECNQSLGYFQSGAYAPKFKCDSTGNWVNIENRCSTSCSEINALTPHNDNDGNAYWSAAIVPNGSNEIDGTFNGCAAGYFRYPYSPPKDKYGNAINQTTDTDGVHKVYVNATASNPQRICQNSAVLGYNNVLAAYWKTAYPACTNKCPGHATDPRVGVGITKHALSNGSSVYLEWDDASPGEEQFRYSSTPQDVSNYAAGRNNGVYAVKRVCGADYKWVTYNGGTETVVPQCSASIGEISGSHAQFSGGTNSPNFTIDETATLTGACVTGYGTQTTNPQYKCQQKDSNRFIDQFYYALSGGGTCERTCAIPAAGTNFGTGSKYVSGASGIYFLNNTIGLTCRTDGNGFGKKIDSDNGNSDSTCGISTTTRTSVPPSTTCLSTGSWSGAVINDCDACRSCTCSEGNCGSAPYPFIKDVSSQNKVIPHTYADDKGSNGDDCFFAGPYSRNDASCGNSGDSSIHVYPGTVQSGQYKDITANGSDSNSVTYRFKCYDGLFTVEQSAKTGNTNDIIYTNF